MADLSTSHASSNGGAGSGNSGGQSHKAGFLRSQKFLGGGGNDVAVPERTALLAGTRGVFGGGHDDDDGGGVVWLTAKKALDFMHQLRYYHPLEQE